MKILVVDDDPAIGTAFRETLPETDEISAVSNYADGMLFVIKEKFDGVILDTCEPDGQIRTMIERIRENSPKTGVVIFSGRAYLNGAFDDLGVFAVVDKSEGVDEAIAAIRRSIVIDEIELVQQLVRRPIYAR